MRGLTCRHPDGGQPALDGVDLDVPAGTLTVVMSTAGAGKSTLARCLARLVPAFVHADVSGEIRVAGRDVAGLRVGEPAGTEGMVFQRTTLRRPAPGPADVVAGTRRSAADARAALTAKSLAPKQDRI